jgi:hypothetical protein
MNSRSGSALSWTKSATIERPKTMFKPRVHLRSPVRTAQARPLRLAWRIAVLIVFATAIFSGRPHRNPAETALKDAMTQATTDADEDDLVW